MTKKWTKSQIIRDVYQLVKEQLCLTLDFDDVDDEFLSGCNIAKREMTKLVKNVEKKLDIKITKQETQKLSNVADIMVIAIEKISERGDLIGAGLNPQPWRHAAWRPNIVFRPPYQRHSNPEDERHLTYNCRQFDGIDNSSVDIQQVKSMNVYSKFKSKNR